MRLPAFLKKYFWDVSFDSLDSRDESYFILERLLEYGDTRAIRWVMRQYRDEELLEVIKTSPRLSAKTGNFWRCYYHLQEDDLRCLRPPSHRRDKVHWNY
ncbi:hypothetical protein E308F_04210 [Moorella sp. E308F]|uniref:DUF6922 domain-containing protein n=1 Tax=unclassified Neomoorella TaxID=2676739 RepID=UPI0010FFB466|nr:hypothetical protein [Moorella sp. (in: firmicutes)]GEA14180.1 hypothetical protein E308F_04210 [Moorella sp. E308F]GEA18435.1 hypothetical protein E306M_15720 [Moorella sp. E306M]